MLKLRKVREEKGIKLVELAQMMGVTPGAVSHWENGRREISLDDAIKIARALECKVEDLISQP